VFSVWLRGLPARASGTFAWAGLALLAHSAPLAVGLLVVGSLSTACSDVVVDSIVVERSRGESQVGRGMSSSSLTPHVCLQHRRNTCIVRGCTVD